MENFEYITDSKCDKVATNYNGFIDLFGSYNMQMNCVIDVIKEENFNIISNSCNSHIQAENIPKTLINWLKHTFTMIQSIYHKSDSQKSIDSNTLCRFMFNCHIIKPTSIFNFHSLISYYKSSRANSNSMKSEVLVLSIDSLFNIIKFSCKSLLNITIESFILIIFQVALIIYEFRDNLYETSIVKDQNIGQCSQESQLFIMDDTLEECIQRYTKLECIHIIQQYCYRLYNDYIKQYIDKYSAVNPFPLLMYREEGLGLQIFWKYKEPLHKIYSYYCKFSFDQKLENSTLSFRFQSFTIFILDLKITEDIDSLKIKNIYYEILSDGNNSIGSFSTVKSENEFEEDEGLSFIKFLEMISYLSVELFTDTYYSRLITIEHKTHYFIYSHISTLYDTLFELTLESSEEVLPKSHKLILNHHKYPAIGFTDEVQYNSPFSVSTKACIISNFHSTPELSEIHDNCIKIKIPYCNFLNNWHAVKLSFIFLSLENTESNTNDSSQATYLSISVVYTSPLEIKVASFPCELVTAPINNSSIVEKNMGDIGISLVLYNNILKLFNRELLTLHESQDKVILFHTWISICIKYDINIGKFNLRALRLEMEMKNDYMSQQLKRIPKELMGLATLYFALRDESFQQAITFKYFLILIIRIGLSHCEVITQLPDILSTFLLPKDRNLSQYLYNKVTFLEESISLNIRKKNVLFGKHKVNLTAYQPKLITMNKEDILMQRYNNKRDELEAQKKKYNELIINTHTLIKSIGLQVAEADALTRFLVEAYRKNELLNKPKNNLSKNDSLVVKDKHFDNNTLNSLLHLKEARGLLEQTVVKYTKRCTKSYIY